MDDVQLITDSSALEELSNRLAKADRIALDSEGNGLHAYASKLCVLQLAWLEDDVLQLAIVDPEATSVLPLAEVLGAAGGAKIIHDLTFDARMLALAGIQLGNVRDTSVSARFLGEKATGLAALVASRVGVKLSKGLQNHDWAQRPLTDKHLRYLSDDVRHLHVLESQLQAETDELGISDEVATECAYKLRQAEAPPRDQRPDYQRIKGYARLDDVGRGVLRALCDARDEIARKRDVPLFRIAASQQLLVLAKRRPSAELLPQLCRGNSAARYRQAWADAIARGRLLPEPVAPPLNQSAPMSRREIALRKRLDDQLSKWRRAEAERRKVDIQVVLPGHCTGPLVGAMVDGGGDPEMLQAALPELDGLGPKRIAAYASEWQSLAAAALGPAPLHAADAPVDNAASNTDR